MERFYQNHHPLFRHILVAEWFLLSLAVIMTTISFAVSGANPQSSVGWTLVGLAALSALSIYFPDRDRETSVSRTTFILVELAVVSAIYAFGLGKFAMLLFYVLVAKICLLFVRKHSWWLLIPCFMAQTLIYGWRSNLLAMMPHTGIWQKALAFFALSSIANTPNIALMFVVTMFVLTLVSEQHLRRKAEELTKENEALAAEVERTRIAREIHDILGHTLTSLKLQLEVARKFEGIDTLRTKNALSTAEQLAARSLTDVRVALQSIRNANFSFDKAVQQLASSVGDHGAIKLSIELEPDAVPPQAGYQLFRVLQECITNTLKHAHATELKITGEKHGSDLKVTIADNGDGFDGEKQTDGYGLRGIRERIENLKGTVAISTSPNHGTAITLIIPAGSEQASSRN